MKKHLPFYSGVLLLVFILQGCLMGESDYNKQVREADEAIEAYLTEHNIEIEKSSSGVYAEMVSENSEGKQVKEEHVIGITYTVSNIEDGGVIESHANAEAPVYFSHSANGLIPAGLNYEIDHMREGETYRFYIPSYQAFGEYSHKDLFPPSTNFLIEVDLVDLKTEEEMYEAELDSIRSYLGRNNIEAESYPNGLYYSETKTGGGEVPGDNSFVKFHFTRMYLDGTVIETTEKGKPIEVYMNEARLVEGLEEGIKLMKEGGKATLIMPSKIAFGKSRQVIPRKVRQDWVENEEIKPLVDPYTPVVYKVELLGVI